MSYSLKCHVARNFQDDDAHKHQLVAQVDGILRHLDICREASGERTGQIHSI